MGLLATVKDGGEMKEFERKINPDVPVAVPQLPPPARHIIDNAGGEQGSRAARRRFISVSNGSRNQNFFAHFYVWVRYHFDEIKFTRNQSSRWCEL